MGAGYLRTFGCNRPAPNFDFTLSIYFFFRPELDYFHRLTSRINSKSDSIKIHISKSLSHPVLIQSFEAFLFYFLPSPQFVDALDRVYQSFGAYQKLGGGGGKNVSLGLFKCVALGRPLALPR